MRLSCIGKFNFRTLLVTIWAVDQDHINAPPPLLPLRQSTAHCGTGRG
jgi:hypothetical protein